MDGCDASTIVCIGECSAALAVETYPKDHDCNNATFVIHGGGYDEFDERFLSRQTGVDCSQRRRSSLSRCSSFSVSSVTCEERGQIWAGIDIMHLRAPFFAIFHALLRYLFCASHFLGDAGCAGMSTARNWPFACCHM